MRLLGCANSCQSLHQSLRLTDSLSILLTHFFCPSVSIHPSVCLSNCSIIHLSFCLSVCLSTPLSVSLSGYSSTINWVDNPKLPCYTLPPMQQHSFLRNLPPLVICFSISCLHICICLTVLAYTRVSVHIWSIRLSHLSLQGLISTANSLDLKLFIWAKNYSTLWLSRSNC